MRNKKIFLWGYYGAQNVGDDLLLSLLLDILLNLNVKVNVIVSKKYKEYINSEKVNYLTIPRTKRFQVIKNVLFYITTIKNNDIIVFGGGTSLFETDNTKYKSLLIKYLILLWNRLFLKRTIVQLGVGIGDVKTFIGKFCLKNIINFSDYANFREENSYQKALSLSKNKDKISLGNDLAYITPFTPRKKTNSYNIGLSLFSYYGYISNDNSKIEVFYNNCKDLIVEILNKNSQVNVHLFSLQKASGGYDEEFNLKLKEEINNHRLCLHLYDSNTTEFIRKIQSMDLCIGMRLHFLILSILHGIPIVGLNYQPKIKNEFLSLNLEEFCIEMIDIFRILTYVDAFLESKECYYAKYRVAFCQVHKKNKQTIAFINNYIINIF